ncbi:acyl-CoA dehydrogenase family protein, partial [candidate division TA06 bacterium]|nr:acyl-CoA dehydrogenase family protein [candidate division TA06 bacterium]
AVAEYALYNTDIREREDREEIAQILNIEDFQRENLDHEELAQMLGIEDFSGNILYHEPTGQTILLVAREGLGRAFISRLLVGSEKPDGKVTIGSGWKLMSQEVSRLFAVGGSIFGGTQPVDEIHEKFRDLYYHDKPIRDETGSIIKRGPEVHTGVLPSEEIVEISKLILLTDERMMIGILRQAIGWLQKGEGPVHEEQVNRILDIQRALHLGPTEVLEAALRATPVKELHVGKTPEMRDVRFPRLAEAIEHDIGGGRLTWVKSHLPHPREFLKAHKELRRRPAELPPPEEGETKRETKTRTELDELEAAVPIEKISVETALKTIPIERVEGMKWAQKVVEVKNPKGLHARPTSGVVTAANKEEFSGTEIYMKNLWKKTPWANVKEMMEVGSVNAHPGDELLIVAQGDQAEEALAAIETEILRKYKEDEPKAGGEESKDGGGTWSANMEEAWTMLLGQIQVVTAGGEKALIEGLYQEFIDKPYRVKQENSQVLAIRNDELLRRMRGSKDVKVRNLYEKLEDFYIEKVKAYTEERIRPIAEKIDRWNLIPLDIYFEMGQLGIYSTQFPQKYGGMGLSVWAWARVNRVVSEASSGITLGALNVLGSLYPYLFERATEAQKEAYLAPVLLGEALGIFGLTESGAGSDNSGIVSEWRNGLVNGEKRFITMGTGILPSDFQEIIETEKPNPDSRLFNKYVWEFGEPGDQGYQGPRYGLGLEEYQEFREQVEKNYTLYIPISHYMITAIRTQPKNEAEPREGIGSVIITLKDAGFEPIPEGDSMVLSQGRGHPDQKITAKSEPVMGQRGSGTTQFFLDSIPVSLETHL